MDNHAIFAAEWHRKMVKALQVTGKGERIQEAYVRVVRLVCEHYRKAPDLLAEEELVDNFIHRQQSTGWSPSTMRICSTSSAPGGNHGSPRCWLRRRSGASSIRSTPSSR